MKTKLGMMILAICIGYSLTGIVAIGKDAPDKKVDGRKAHLKQLESLLGTWVAEGEQPGMGKFKHTITFKWILNKQWVQMDGTMETKGKKDSTTTIMGWDKKLEKPIFTVYGENGSLTHAVRSKKVGNTATYECTASGAGPFEKFTEFIDDPQDGKFNFEIQIKMEGKPVTFYKAVYKKKK